MFVDRPFNSHLIRKPEARDRVNFRLWGFPSRNALRGKQERKGESARPTSSRRPRPRKTNNFNVFRRRRQGFEDDPFPILYDERKD